MPGGGPKRGCDSTAERAASEYQPEDQQGYLQASLAWIELAMMALDHAEECADKANESADAVLREHLRECRQAAADIRARKRIRLLALAKLDEARGT